MPTALRGYLPAHTKNSLLLEGGPPGETPRIEMYCFCVLAAYRLVYILH